MNQLSNRGLSNIFEVKDSLFRVGQIQPQAFFDLKDLEELRNDFFKPRPQHQAQWKHMMKLVKNTSFTLGTVLCIVHNRISKIYGVTITLHQNDLFELKNKV